jgi:hypothetical protein
MKHELADEVEQRLRELLDAIEEAMEPRWLKYYRRIRNFLWRR